ncbi:guanine deaminase [bacterium]|nr:guanine deaminase [bacterium]
MDIKDIKAIKGSILHFFGNPELTDSRKAYEYFENGVLIVENGHISLTGPYDELKQSIPDDAEIHDYSGKLILPGFIDTHLHYPQTDIIASYGKQLMEWLEKYTFPREGKFENSEYAESVAEFFLDELLRNGTTTAQVMSTVHMHSADILFRKSWERNLSMITGKVMMDRNAPEYLLDDPIRGYEESLELIHRWHEKDRLLYAVTPRFAITSTEEQLKKSAELLDAAPNLYLHTHLSENKDEIAFVAELFPWSKDYLDVYDKFGLVTRRSTYAHSIHLSNQNFKQMAEKKASIAFCPTSNLFIGSGLFNLRKPVSAGVKVGIGTDIGGGTSFSILRTLGEAYKVLQLRGQSLSPLKAFYLATQGGAESLCLDDKIGNFKTGKEADFIVLNLDSTPLIKRRMEYTDGIDERLFILMMLGDDRSIEATYVMGQKVFSTDH